MFSFLRSLMGILIMFSLGVKWEDFFISRKTLYGVFVFLSTIFAVEDSLLGFYILHFLSFGFILSFFALLGIFFNDKNLIFLVMYLDLLLLGISLNFIIFSVYWGDPKGIIMALCILAYAAAESGIGLALVVHFYLYTGSLDVKRNGLLHG